MCVYMCHFFVYIFSVTEHHGRTVWLNGPPCINIFVIKYKCHEISAQLIGSCVDNKEYVLGWRGLIETTSNIVVC